jgi:hypothetical protein
VESWIGSGVGVLMSAAIRAAIAIGDFEKSEYCLDYLRLDEGVRRCDEEGARR